MAAVEVAVCAQLERLIAEWRNRAADGRRGRPARLALESCADEAQGALIAVRAQVSRRSVAGWKTRRANEKKRKRRASREKRAGNGG